MKRILLLLIIGVLLPVNTFANPEQEQMDECPMELIDQFDELIKKKELELSDEDFIMFYNQLGEKILNLSEEDIEECVVMRLNLVWLIHGTLSNTITEPLGSEDLEITPRLEIPENISLKEDKRIGMGVNFQTSTYRPYIVQVFDDSPAQKAGFEAGDIVLEINGEPVVNKSYTQLVSGIDGEEVKFKILRDFKEKDIKLIQGEFEVEEHEYNYSTIAFTDIYTDSGQTYENKYRIKDFDSTYEYYFVFHTDSMYSGQTSYFDKNGEILSNFKSKKLDNSEFIVDAYDISDSPEGEYNEFTGRVFVKYRGKYYYGSKALAGFFNLNLDGKIKQVKSEILGWRYGLSHDEKNNLSETITTALNAYKNTVRDDTYYHKTRELSIAINAAIHSTIEGISSQEDIINNAEALHQLFIIEEILEGIWDVKNQETMDGIIDTITESERIIGD